MATMWASPDAGLRSPPALGVANMSLSFTGPGFLPTCDLWETVENIVRLLDPKHRDVVGVQGALRYVMLDNHSKKATFEMFRRNLRNPEVITYDELLERAVFTTCIE